MDNGCPRRQNNLNHEALPAKRGRPQPLGNERAATNASPKGFCGYDRLKTCAITSLLRNTFKRARDFEILLDDVIWRLSVGNTRHNIFTHSEGEGKRERGRKSAPIEKALAQDWVIVSGTYLD
jgi:hypothetical protein